VPPSLAIITSMQVELQKILRTLHATPYEQEGRARGQLPHFSKHNRKPKDRGALYFGSRRDRIASRLLLEQLGNDGAERLTRESRYHYQLASSPVSTPTEHRSPSCQWMHCRAVVQHYKHNPNRASSGSTNPYHRCRLWLVTCPRKIGFGIDLSFLRTGTYR
jgi:hypothetical protein